MWSGGEGEPGVVSSTSSPPVPPPAAAVDLSFKPPQHQVLGEVTESSSTNPSAKEILLEMTNHSNPTILPPSKWAIIKKEAEPVLVKHSGKTEDKKGRPTALVGPFPADNVSPPAATLQTSIKDWLGRTSQPESGNQGAGMKPKEVVRPKNPKISNGGRVLAPRKKPLTAIVAELTAGNASNSPEPPIKPLTGESVSFSSSHRLSGGEVSVSESAPDLSVINRLKRLGTVIQVEDQTEKDSLKLLEKMTKSVSSKVEKTSISVFDKQSARPANTRQGLKQSKLQPPKELSKSTTIRLTVPSEMPIITLTNVPSEQTSPRPSEAGQLSKDSLQDSESHSLGPRSSNLSDKFPPGRSSSQPKIAQSSLVQTKNIALSKAQPPLSPLLHINNKALTVPSINSTLFQPSSQSTKDLPVLISLTPKIQFAQRPKQQNSKVGKLKTPTKSKLGTITQFTLNRQPKLPLNLPLPMSPHSPLYISKDVTLIPKPLSETLHDKIEPSLLEPVIDILEEENVLTQDGKFIFKTDSFHNIDLPNEQKVFSCDICSAVYTHSNLLRKHYLRLHISRKYISEKDMEAFNIDPELTSETSGNNLIYRCHNCRECFTSKSDLRSHLTDHPPVDELAKQNNKSHQTYKCENCSTVFKWRKQFGKHKKVCKVSPPPPPVAEKPELYHCLYCNETFLNGNAKRNHILSYHPYVRRKHRCVFCKRDGFPTNVSLFLHLLNDHPTVYFACQLCKERFTHLEDLKQHVEKRHDQDDKLKSSMSERVSNLNQEKMFYSCDTCQRKFLIENCFKEHKCLPEKQEKPKLQKIRKKVHNHLDRSEKSNHKTVDMETLFFSQVSRNVRDNLSNHLDGKIYRDEISEEEHSSEELSPNNSRTCLNFSDGFPSSSKTLSEDGGADTPTRSKAPWEKYNFPKNYDGRCGLSSYIKDTAYLDISTQLIMRRNLQRLNMLPMKESPSNDVPSAVDLERLGAECAESFGQPKKEKTGEEEEDAQLGSLSGEWVRERKYVCSACRWETPCLWEMEDHKYLAHPRVHCPQHELVGEQIALSQTIYQRLVDESPFDGPKPPAAPIIGALECTKCGKSGFSGQEELHVHILECAGVLVEAVGPPSKKRRRRSRRRPRRGLKRNIPQTPQKLPPKQRTKPGDTDTIQKMIANLPPKRVSRKVLSSFDENKARLKAKKEAEAAKGGKAKKSKETEKRSQSEPPSTPRKEPERQLIFASPVVIKKEQDYIDTSAEGGDVLSSLRMMPVRAMRPPAELSPSPQNVEDKEMPTLEIEKDISPVESSEIPVLSPADNSEKEVKKEASDLICGISFVDGKIKYETVSSISEETGEIEGPTRKRKSSSSCTSPSEKKKSCKVKISVLPSKEVSQHESKIESSVVEIDLSDSNYSTLGMSGPESHSSTPENVEYNNKKGNDQTVSSVGDAAAPLVSEPSGLDALQLLNSAPSRQKGRKTRLSKNFASEENVSSAGDIKPLVSEFPEQPKTIKSPLKPNIKKTRKNSVDKLKDDVDTKTITIDINQSKSILDPDVPNKSEKGVRKSASRLRGKKIKNKKQILSVGDGGEEIVTSAMDVISPIQAYQNLDTPPALDPPVSNPKEERSSQLTLGEENVMSVPVVPLSSDADKEQLEPPTLKAAIAKSKGKKTNKLGKCSGEGEVSSASSLAPSEELVSECDKPPTLEPILPKTKGKKPNKPSDNFSEEEVPLAANVAPVPEITASSKMSGKTRNTRSKDLVISEDLISSSDSVSTALPVNETITSITADLKLKVKKSSDIPDEGSNPIVDEVTLMTEAAVEDTSKQSPDLPSVPEVIEATQVKQRNRKTFKKSPIIKPNKNLLFETSVGETCVKINQSVPEVIPPSLSRNQKKNNDIPGPELTLPIRRGPGRPRGALTRRFQNVETRRSSRKASSNNISSVKYDEILPCEEEDEVKEVKRKPEKAGRKPRTVKEPPVSDSTTIIVEVEVHPEPTLKRKIEETRFIEDADLKNDVLAKKIKEDNQSIETNIKIDDHVNATKEVSSKLLKDLGEENKLLKIDTTTIQFNVQSDGPVPSPQKHGSDSHTKPKEKKFVISLSPSGDSFCYKVHAIEKNKREENIPKDQNQSKAMDVYEFLDNEGSEQCFSFRNSTLNKSSETISPDSSVVAKDTKHAEKNLPIEENPDHTHPSEELPKTTTVISQIKDNSDINITENSEGTIINKESSEKDIPQKKKKIGKKTSKAKIKLPNEEDSGSNDIPVLEKYESKNENIDFKEKPHEEEKVKKFKKVSRKDSTDLTEAKKTKKETNELNDAKKLKKVVKKKKIIKKVVKIKKRSLTEAQKSGKVVSIAGFTWEVSELESSPLVDSISSGNCPHPAPDSSVGELPTEAEEVLAKEESIGEYEFPSPPSLEPEPPLKPAQLNTHSALPEQDPLSTQPVLAPALTAEPPEPSPFILAPVFQPCFAQSGPSPVTAARPTPIVPARPPSVSQAEPSVWEPTTSVPWEPTPPEPTGLGTILDSVNKLLNEPESSFTPLGLPSYSLADLQKAMGASDAEMAVLQQLGEASLQISSNDSGKDSDDWNGEKCIMDLDSHTPLLRNHPSPAATLSPQHDLIIKEEDEWGEKGEGEVGSSSLLEAHQGKEVLCPSCSCHFMGFPALQKHLAKAHPSVDPESKHKRGAGTPFTKTDLNRRMPLDACKGPRLVCFSCQQILPSDRMGLHLDQEHGIATEEVSKCASLSGETQDGPVIGERLRSKMSTKLGDLLEKAVNNLLQAKNKPNNTLSGGAVELLTKLCAVRKREGSVKHRLHGARELLSKLQRQQEQRADESVEEVKVVKKLFSCSICGLKFSLPSSRNKHEVLAHRSYRPIEHELDEYENDWREAPSPPEIQGENGESVITPQCSDCGLSFDSIQEMMRHRVEDHATRRSSVDTNPSIPSTSVTGRCLSPVGSSAGSRSQPDSEGEMTGESGEGVGGKLRGNKTRKHGLSHNGSRLVKERAEAALRELNHPRQRPGHDRHRWQMKRPDIYGYTEDSL